MLSMSDNTNNIHKVKMSNKGKKIYLPTTTYRDQFIQNFKIIYPLGGTEENPATVNYGGKQYIEPNPFPGYYINVIPEIFYADKWGDPGWGEFFYSSSYYSYGIRATQFDGDIRIIIGTDVIMYSDAYKFSIQGYPWDKVSGHVRNNIPIRLKVWKIGVMD